MKSDRVVVVLAIVGALVGAFLGRGGSEALPELFSDPVHQNSEPQSLVAVYVSGAVLNPGVVWTRTGTLIAEAIALAGGALPEARLDQINLAEPVGEGDHIDVPSSLLASEVEGTGDGLIDINRADQEELESLPGVGPVLAARIVAYRESVGPFETVEELLQVSGIGEAILASLRDFVSPP